MIANVALVVALLVVLGGTATWLSVGRSGDPAAALRTVPVGRGLVAETVAASGTVVSGTSSSVGFATSGRVTDVRVGLGERVVEGQVLATLDDEYAQANLRAAQAGLTAARQQLDDAENGTATTTTSNTGGTGTGAGGAGGQSGGAAQGGAAQGGTQGSSEGQLDQLRSQVAQARATVIDAQRSVDNTVLTAPQDGTVVSLDGRVGQTVSGSGTQVTSTGSGSPSAGAPSSGGGTGAGGTSGGGAAGGGASGGAAQGSAGAGGSGAGSASGSAATSFLSLADLDTLQVQAQLPELDVGQVRDGQAVAVSINALPGQSLRGVVSGVNALPGTGASVQYGTTIGLEGRPPGLRLGQSASVAITTAQAEGTLFLPNAAVEPQGGTTATQGSVLVYAGGRQERRTVGLGIAADTVTQITNGLSVGDLVVLPEPAVTSPFQGGRGPNGGGQGGNDSGGGGGGGAGGDGAGGGG